MKICLYSPYVPKHVGGGEKYFFDVARILAEQHNVDVVMTSQIDDVNAVRSKYERFLNASLAKVAFVSSPLGTNASLLQKVLWTRKYDVVYAVTDGSFFFSLAPKNILHIQIPFTTHPTKMMEKFKLNSWQIKNTNSAFTKKVIEKNWQITIDEVHYPILPPARNLSDTQLLAKEKIILHVGRFFSHLHSKRQDVLVEVFRELLASYPKEMAGWKLVCIGSVEDEHYAQKVHALAEGLPVEFFHDATREQLNEWYDRATFYWHATGFEVDEENEPEKVEHFGISTGEAMAAGCVPLVVGKGGQTEVLGEDLKNFLWQTKKECVEKTIQLIQNTSLRVQVAHQALQQVGNFSEERFRQTLHRMIEG